MNRNNLFFISLIGFMIYILVELNYIRKTQDMILKSNSKMLELMIEDIDRYYQSNTYIILYLHQYIFSL